MSQAAPNRPTALPSQARIAIVASLYNDVYVKAMIDSVQKELEVLAPQAQLTIHRVPGAFEIPVCAELVLRNQGADAVIALGVILRGATDHADLVGSCVTDALQRIAVAHVTPVVHEVLLLNDEAQARERCLGDRINRGTEAARVAVDMLRLFEKLRSTFPSPQPSS